MEFNDKYIKRIEAYLDGEMTGEERIKFEQEIERDTVLKKDLKLHKDIRKAFKLNGKEEVRQKLENFYNEYKKVKSRRRTYRILIPVISAAATILILLVVYLGKTEMREPSKEYITLDSIKINKNPEYADSAKYELNNEKDTIK